MTRKPPVLQLDFKSREEILKVVPTSITSSNDDAGWEDIRLEEFESPAGWETPKHTIAQHLIVVHLNALTGSERTIAECHKYENPRIGDIAFIPAGTDHWTADREAAKGIALLVEPSFIAETAFDFIKSDQVEFTPTFARADDFLYHLALTLKGELEENGGSDRLYADSMKTLTAWYLLRHYNPDQSLLHTIGQQQRQKLKQAIEYIQDNIQRPIKLEELALMLQVSQIGLLKIFKHSLKVSPARYIAEQRVERAQVMLEKSRLSTSAIAKRCGFSSQQQLIKQFKKVTGTTPSFYRECCS